MKKPCQRTVLVALDLKSAFDTVDHATLLNDIRVAPLPNTIKRFVAAYLKGRSTYVEFRSKRSKLRKMQQGVPQGGVHSPVLFNIYMSPLPTPPKHIHLVSFADDISIMSSGTEPVKITSNIQPYLNELTEWLRGRNLTLSPGKCTATLFTTWSKEYKCPLVLKVANTTIPTSQQVKVLGVTFDTMHKFSQHATNTCAKVSQRNNILKQLAGTDWGCSKEILTTTYKAVGRSVLNYAYPIWATQLSDTKWEDLQRRQNCALRTITGCHKMSPISHLHQETRILPVKEHSMLLAKQFFLQAHDPTRPDHHTTVPPPPGTRKLRPTLQQLFGEDVSQTIGKPLNNINREDIKAGVKKLHQEAAKKANETNTSAIWASYSGDHVPQISKEEKELSRKAGSRLSQLRSGYSTLLNSYKARIDTAVLDKCPDCDANGHTTQHLFNCPSKPTNIRVGDLWLRPRRVAEFLDLDSQ